MDTDNYINSENLLINKVNGAIYAGRNTNEVAQGLKNGSKNLAMYYPQIHPGIERKEVAEIKEWINADDNASYQERMLVVYGSAGVGKSVVMHNLLLSLQASDEIFVLGIKADLIQFVDIDDLSDRMHFTQPLDLVIEELAMKVKRFVLIIDQIDALSFSLSSNRTPIRSLMLLIKTVRNIRNVRIVVSCRSYDLENTPLLEEISNEKKIEIKEISPEEVKNIIRFNHIDAPINEKILPFLGNPLHLLLFLKLSKKQVLKPLFNREDLYNSLWSRNIVDAPENSVKKNNLLMCLDDILSDMYSHQNLSVHYRLFETSYADEIRYLLHTEMFICTQEGIIQFFHQTLFDYAFARRFTETGKDLIEFISKGHQGLFIRPLVRSVLSFQRSTCPSEYIRNVRLLLFKLNDKQESLFRYHIIQLVISSMPYWGNPINEERALVKEKLFNDTNYAMALMDAVHTIEWFKLMISVIELRGGWDNLINPLKERCISLCVRLSNDDEGTDIALSFLYEVVKNSEESERNFIVNLLDTYYFEKSNGKLADIYELITTSRYPLQHRNLLEGLVDYEPGFVQRELMENIRLQQLARKERKIEEIKFDEDEKCIYRKLQEKHPDLCLTFYLDVLKMTLQRNIDFFNDDYEIKETSCFYGFKREQYDSYSDNFISKLVNRILDLFEDSIGKGENYYDDLIGKLMYADDEAMVYIALYCSTLNCVHYRDLIFKALLEREMLVNSTEWIEYESAELLRKSFHTFSYSQKKKMLDHILTLKEKREYTLFSKSWPKEHLKSGRPLLSVGVRVGTLLSILPEKELQEEFKEAYLFLCQLRRKFSSSSFENNEPLKTTWHIGDSNVGERNASRIDNQSWEILMRKYITNDTRDWDIPTLSGQRNLFEHETQNNPDLRFPLILRIIEDSSIPLEYAISGMKGLLQAKCFDSATKVFIALLRVLNTNRLMVGEKYIQELLFSINDFFESDELPKEVFDFIRTIVLGYEDDCNGPKYLKDDVFNYGLNTIRGNAGYKLVQCANYPTYVSQVFDTLEKIAQSSSVYTRAAILFNFALLGKNNLERGFNLFKSLLYDFHPQLLALRLHNMNPFLFFIDEKFDEMYPLFEVAIKDKVCHQQQVLVLWVAWMRTKRGEAKLLLDGMCNQSEEARLSLLNCINRSDGELNTMNIELILQLMNPVYHSKEMVNGCDCIFHKYKGLSISNWVRVAEQFVSFAGGPDGVHYFFKFLREFSQENPLLTLQWLSHILRNKMPDHFFDWKVVADVLILAYNGISSFDEDIARPLLDESMDLLDNILKDSNNRYLIKDFLQKLDKE